MSSPANNETWVFLSHSNKDYEKVRQVRNLLEEQSLRPLMFFLHCLNDDDEIDSLIKREIDCRTRFILCDSENARKSHWVRKEVEYIKSQNRIYETIDLSQSMDKILEKLQDFINKTRIFISYNREEYHLADRVCERLSRLDFSVYIDRLWDFANEYNQDYNDALEYLQKSAARSDGYVVAIMNERILQPSSSSRYELLKFINKSRQTGKTVPNIIPFVKSDRLIKLISEDPQLHSLINCGIENIGDLGKKQQCDAIITRVVTQLMTPGSIKVMADNMAKGIFGEADKDEADFLYKLSESVALSTYRNESGTFYVDRNGIVQSFEPSDGNNFIEENTELHDHSVYHTSRSLRTLIVPEGVKGFAPEFMRGVRITERFELPHSLESIGDRCFANCILPEVIIPSTLKTLGTFAFGHSHIDCLRIPETLSSPYERQFKDSYIGTLYLPEKWGNYVSLDSTNHLSLHSLLAYDANYSYMKWPSTFIRTLKFY